MNINYTLFVDHISISQLLLLYGTSAQSTSAIANPQQHSHKRGSTINLAASNANYSAVTNKSPPIPTKEPMRNSAIISMTHCDLGTIVDVLKALHVHSIFTAVEKEYVAIYLAIHVSQSNNISIKTPYAHSNALVHYFLDDQSRDGFACGRHNTLRY